MPREVSCVSFGTLVVLRCAKEAHTGIPPPLSLSQTNTYTHIVLPQSNTNQDLTHERAKMTALVEELELPLNVHRWRKLESSDPERYDLVRKAQSLQRSLVSKTESAARKDLLIQEKVGVCLRVQYEGKSDTRTAVRWLSRSGLHARP